MSLNPSPTPNTASNALIDRVEQLNAIGISLSAEKDNARLLEKILIGAKTITNADGGTLYLVTHEKQQLCFMIMRNDSLGIARGGTTGIEINLPSIALYDEQGIPNTTTVSAFCAVSGLTVNIADAYKVAEGFDFSGTKKYDKETGYRSTSFLTIPMKNHEGDTIGVLQLINARNAEGNTVAFSNDDQRLAESLASQAAVALTNNQLLTDLRHLIEKFIEVLADTIDEKSPYTGGHCRRVPEVAMLLADAVNAIKEGPHAEKTFTPEELYELKIAALLHDCGKITTPIHVVDKATKLEAIFDRIHLVDSRFELIARDLHTTYLNQRDACANDKQRQQLFQEYNKTLGELHADQEFLHTCNIGSEFMEPAKQQRVKEIGARRWKDSKGNAHTLLSENEIENLNIPKGTLLPEERKVINNHIVTTIHMLESLPFPKYLKNVPEIAGGHHERMDGKGYPRGLTREQMSLQARIMGIADIFEALTAADRPYKKPMSISVALKIMENMKNEGHIDPDLYDVFVKQKVYLTYGEQYLRPEQLDDKSAKPSS